MLNHLNPTLGVGGGMSVKMQVPRPCPKTGESESPGLSHAAPCFNKQPTFLLDAAEFGNHPSMPSDPASLLDFD